MTSTKYYHVLEKREGKMGEGMLSLSWNNHSSTFCHMLSTLREVERFTDVTITCGGKFYPVHKLILSTCSDYFLKMFDETPCKHPMIVLKDIQCKDMEALLSYMYAGVVSVAQSDLAQLIKAAELLQIKGLAVPDEPPKTNKRQAAPPSREETRSTSPKRQRPNDKGSRDVIVDRVFSDVQITHKKTPDKKTIDAQRARQEANEREKANKVSEEDDDDDEIEVISRQVFPSSQVEAVVEDSLVKEEEEMVSESSDTELGSTSFNYSNLQCNVSAGRGRSRESREPGEVDDYGQQTYHSHGHLQHLQAGAEIHAGPSLLQGWPGIGELGEGSSTVHGYSENLSSGYQHSLVGANTEAQRTTEADNFGLGKILASVTQLRQFPGHQQYSESELDNIYRQGGGKGLKKSKKTYSCTQCSYKTAIKSNLVIHFRTHTGERPFKCPTCSFSASFEYNLKVHLRTHTGEKPYLCPHCPLRFSQKAHLKNHLYTHTGEKPFSCGQCSAKFSRMSNLRRHLQTHQACRAGNPNFSE